MPEQADDQARAKLNFFLDFLFNPPYKGDTTALSQELRVI